MNSRQLLGIVGTALLFVGVFMPIIKVPIIGDMNYFQNGKGDGVFVLVFAVGSFALVLARQYKGLWITSIGSAVVLAFSFINFQSTLSQMKAEMEADLAGNPFRGLADLAMQSVQLQWGWAVLIIGVALLMVTAAMKEEEATPPSPQSTAFEKLLRYSVAKMPSMPEAATTSVAPKPDEGHALSHDELMMRYGISDDGQGRYQYGQYRYDKLEDAVAYAKAQQEQA